VAEWRVQEEPQIPDPREQVIDPATAYQLVSILQGVVDRGTGVRIREVGRPLAGKTGTTNDSNDAWFIGFAPDLAVGVYVGYDKPKSLGDKETGSSVAVPIFRDFMKEALEGQPVIPFRVPGGIRLVRVHAESGLLAVPGDSPVILEAFKPGTEPTSGQRTVLDGTESIVIEHTGAPAGRGAMPPPGAGSASGLY
jgi:penicillin-binding protein 1A